MGTDEDEGLQLFDVEIAAVEIVILVVLVGQVATCPCEQANKSMHLYVGYVFLPSLLCNVLPGCKSIRPYPHFNSSSRVVPPYLRLSCVLPAGYLRPGSSGLLPIILRSSSVDPSFILRLFKCMYFG